MTSLPNSATARHESNSIHHSPFTNFTCLANMAKITFDEAEDADNMPLPVSEEEEEPSSSEATVHQSNEEEEEEDDSDAPEALSTVNVKSALKDSNKVQRLQQEA